MGVGTDAFTHLQLAPTATGIIQVDSEAHREDRGPCHEKHSTRKILRIAPRRLECELSRRLILSHLTDRPHDRTAHGQVLTPRRRLRSPTGGRGKRNSEGAWPLPTVAQNKVDVKMSPCERDPHISHCYNKY